MKPKKIAIGVVLLALTSTSMVLAGETVKPGVSINMSSASSLAELLTKDAAKPFISERAKTTAKDPKIRSEAAKANQPGGKKVVVPPQKGGPKTRQQWGQTWVDNRTNYSINVYIDGDFEGTVGAHNDLLRWVNVGKHKVYCRADFMNGSVKSWEWNDEFIGADNRIHYVIFDSNK